MREQVLNGVIKLEYYATSEEAANGFIKPLRYNRFTRFIELLGTAISTI